MSKVIRETCVAGAVISVIIKGSIVGRSRKRKPKQNPTKESVEKNNLRIAIRKLAALMNANFYPGDYHLTLTYANEPTREEAKKELDRFLRRIKREYEKIGKDFYWIAVTEYKNKRIHHHLVISYIDFNLLRKQWTNGHCWVSSLDRTRNYTKLAEYFIKETQKTFRDPENVTKQRWRASRNLKRPVVKKELVSVKQLYKDPKPLKGYEINPETIHKFEHPFTGMPHIEYQMTSTEPVPRIKMWRKGKIINRQETYKRAAEIQIDFNDLIEVSII